MDHLKHATHLRLIIFILALALSLPLLAPRLVAASLDDTPIRQARLYEKQNNYRQASDMYLMTAQILSDGEGEKWRVKAAEMAWFAGNPRQASKILTSVDESHLDRITLIHSRLIAARIARSRGDYASVLKKLNFPSSSAPPKLQKPVAALLEEAREKTAGRQMQSIPSRISPAFGGNKMFSQTWERLMGLSTQDLARRLAQPLSPIDKGWTELAYIAKTSLDSPEALDNQLTRWEEEYRNHPAYPDYSSALRSHTTLTNSATLPNQIGRVAVLLPTSGPLANLANVILEGIMAAKYQMPETRIKVYDTAAGDDIVALYQQAVSEGAELVIGPMDKTRVDTLARAPLSVPVISLNYGNDPALTNPNLFQFALLPEDEARQAAKQMLADGYTRLAVLVPDGRWGDRILQAFQQATRDQGGEVVAVGRFKTHSNDYSHMIQRTLKPNAKTHLNGVDADAIFFAASPQQARLLMPLIKFHFINSLPVYATSHAYAGIPDRNANRDLNRLSITEIPWLLKDAPANSPTLADLDDATRHYPRLFAFGYDALNAAPRLRQENGMQNPVHGLSGILALDSRNRIHRKLGWATFSRGQARLLHAPETETRPSQLMTLTQ